MTAPGRSNTFWAVGLLAAFLLIPYWAAALTGQPAAEATGLLRWHTAAESVYCKDGLTPTGAILLAELAVLLVGVLLAHWRPGWLGPAANLLRKDGWLLCGIALLIVIPFAIAAQTDTSACTRGRAFFWESIFIDVYILAILAISYNLLFGFAGVVSFGHAAFFGLGAYSVGIFMKLLDWPWWQAIVGSLLIGVLVAVIKGVVGLRIKGLYFALFTLALAQVFFLLAGNRLLTEITGAEDGFTFSVPDWLNTTRNRLMLYYVALMLLVLSYALVRRLMNSPTGKVLLALRENEGRAQMLGYNTFHFKLIAIILSGLLATGAGVMRGLALKGANPEVLSLTYTFDPLLMTLIGGQGTFLGPVVGAFGIHLTEQALRDSVFTLGGVEFNIGERWALILGVLFVISVMIFPHGIVGTWRQRSLQLRQGWGKLFRSLGGGSHPNP